LTDNTQLLTLIYIDPETPIDMADETTQTVQATGPDTLSLKGKVAIVTGSGRENGIGAGIAYAFGKNGASVVVTYVSPATETRAQAVVEKIKALGGDAIAVAADLTQEEGAEKIVQETLKAFGPKIHILGK
jgi:NAD(P)-dependent dehydrogenase (short-subunit alcohol dehydrogenase family)